MKKRVMTRIGYIEKGAGRNPKFGRYISSDGNYQVRMGDDDLLGNHMNGPHINIEKLKPNSLNPKRCKTGKDIHLYFHD